MTSNQPKRQQSYAEYLSQFISDEAQLSEREDRLNSREEQVSLREQSVREREKEVDIREQNVSRDSQKLKDQWNEQYRARLEFENWMNAYVKQQQRATKEMFKKAPKPPSISPLSQGLEDTVYVRQTESPPASTSMFPVNNLNEPAPHSTVRRRRPSDLSIESLDLPQGKRHQQHQTSSGEGQSHKVRQKGLNLGQPDDHNLDEDEDSEFEPDSPWISENDTAGDSPSVDRARQASTVEHKVCVCEIDQFRLENYVNLPQKVYDKISQQMQRWDRQKTCRGSDKYPWDHRPNGQLHCVLRSFQHMRSLWQKPGMACETCQNGGYVCAVVTARNEMVLFPGGNVDKDPADVAYWFSSKGLKRLERKLLKS